MNDAVGLRPDPNAPAMLSEDSPRPPAKQRLRRIVTWVLVVLFAVLTPLTLVSAWAVKTVTNTNRYVATLQPLAQDPVVTNYIADKATTELFTQLDVQQRVAKLLPSFGSALAAPLTQQLEHYTQIEMRKVTASKWFADFWRSENTYTHSAAVAILTGKDAPPVNHARALAITLSPAIIQAIDKLDAKGVTVFDPIKNELKTNQKLTFNLYSNKQIKSIQKIFNLAIELRVALLVGTPLIGLAAILIAVERRRAAMRVFLGAILGILVLLGALTYLRSEFINALPADAQLFAQHVWDTMLRFLKQTINYALLISVLAVIVLWLWGDSTWALAIRRVVTGGSKQLSKKAGEVYHSETTAKAVNKATDILEQADGFVKKNLKAMRWVGVVVAALFLFTSSTTGGLFWTVVLLALYEILITVPWVRRKRLTEEANPELVEAQTSNPGTDDNEVPSAI